ncbi:MAG: YggS family pyridoxal phosphate-dependent enzyme [Candidatus Kapaibacteriales bacterium]
MSQSQSIEEETISQRVQSVSKHISKLSEDNHGSSDAVKLIAVSKTFPFSSMQEAYDAGIVHFGESYPQEFRDKYEPILNSGILEKSVELHFIGSLQRNKVKYVIGKVCLIHGVDSIKLINEINKQAEKNNISQDILLQVNISDEESKSGFSYDDLDNAVSHCTDLDYIRLRGLMGISGLESSDDKRRDEFKGLKKAFDNLKIRIKNFDYLSMGMSGDYEIAIQEGSNMVRVGSAIFGERSYD